MELYSREAVWGPGSRKGRRDWLHYFRQVAYESAVKCLSISVPQGPTWFECLQGQCELNIQSADMCWRHCSWENCISPMDYLKCFSIESEFLIFPPFSANVMKTKLFRNVPKPWLIPELTIIVNLWPQNPSWSWSRVEHSKQSTGLQWIM